MHNVKLISRRFPQHSGRATVVLVRASLSALALGLGMLAVTRSRRDPPRPAHPQTARTP